MVSLFRLTFRQAREDRLVQIAGSLSFTTVLAIVPLLVIAFSLFTRFPIFHDFQVALEASLIRNLLPREMARTILRSLNNFAENASGLTAWGVAFVALVAIAMMHTVENAFNQIWGVKKGRPFLKRLGLYSGVLIFGPAVLGASLWATSYVVSASLGWIGKIPSVVKFFLNLGPMLLMIIAFSAVFYTVPNTRVVPRDALVGGILAGIAFEWLKRGFAVYLVNFPTYRVVYGAFAAVPAFLLWVYVSWWLTLTAALVTANLSRVRLARSKVPRRQ